MYIYLYLSIYLSLSLSIYIYIYTCALDTYILYTDNTILLYTAYFSRLAAQLGSCREHGLGVAA